MTPEEVRGRESVVRDTHGYGPAPAEGKVSDVNPLKVTWQYWNGTEWATLSPGEQIPEGRLVAMMPTPPTAQTFRGDVCAGSGAASATNDIPFKIVWVSDPALVNTVFYLGANGVQTVPEPAPTLGVGSREAADVLATALGKAAVCPVEVLETTDWRTFVDHDTDDERSMQSVFDASKAILVAQWTRKIQRTMQTWPRCAACGRLREVALETLHAQLAVRVVLRCPA